MSAGSVSAAQFAFQQTRGGASPTPALQDLKVQPIPKAAAKEIIVRQHYLHSVPGGTILAFGVFVGPRLMGAITLGAGPFNAHSLVEGASQDDRLTLSRLWLADDLPRNSESWVLGVVLRAMRGHTNVGFLLTYADPSQGHMGIIYQATGWIYTGASERSPRYDLGDGKPAHCRTVAAKYGSRSVHYLRDHGVPVRLIPQAPKHRYLYFIDPTLTQRLKVPVLPYPKTVGLPCG